MELVQELSNPELGPELDRLAAALVKLRRRAAKHKVVVDPGPLRQGDVLEAIKAVLAEYPDGLRQCEVVKQVEQRLGRSVSPSTVRTNLAYNAAFERIAYGRYRLVGSNDDVA
jgi:hypothetical protein